MPTFHSVFEKLIEKWNPPHIITLYMQFTENLTHYCSLLNYSPVSHIRFVYRVENTSIAK